MCMCKIRVFAPGGVGSVGGFFSSHRWAGDYDFTIFGRIFLPKKVSVAGITEVSTFRFPKPKVQSPSPFDFVSKVQSPRTKSTKVLKVLKVRQKVPL